MSFGSWAAHMGRDNALVSPWAQGKLAYGEVRPDPSAPRQSPNPANRPGFYSGGTGGTVGGSPSPGGGNAYGNSIPWAGVSGGIDGGARGPNAPAASRAAQPAGFQAGISRGTGAGNGAQGGTPDPAATPTHATGSQSGPGILESWFNQRANGIDAASQYATQRGMGALANQYSAAGSFNSGAARQGESDLLANIEAQRSGQLDALAAGASGEHQNRFNSSIQQMLGLGGGQSAVNSSYDLAAGKAQSDALSALLGFTTNKAGVDAKSNQQGFNNGLSLASLFA
jgi:hypothetical protein